MADKCGLFPISKVDVLTANGTKKANVYLISILLPNNLVLPLLRVTEADLIGEANVLIGMDIISLGDFAITNLNKKTTFSFRMPSRCTIDFRPENEAKLKPNDPCFCGSGSKYKKCHGIVA